MGEGENGVEEIRLFCGGESRGRVILSEGDSRREIRVSMADPGDGLYRAFLVGERGELPLGVMEPEAGKLSVTRRVYSRDIAALGRLERGEARLSFRFAESAWQDTADPGEASSIPELHVRLKKIPRAWLRRERERLLLAIPLKEGDPFPLEILFCLARVLRVEGQICAVYDFDRQGRPLPP